MPPSPCIALFLRIIFVTNDLTFDRSPIIHVRFREKTRVAMSKAIPKNKIQIHEAVQEGVAFKFQLEASSTPNMAEKCSEVPKDGLNGASRASMVKSEARRLQNFNDEGLQSWTFLTASKRKRKLTDRFRDEGFAESESQQCGQKPRVASPLHNVLSVVPRKTTGYAVPFTDSENKALTLAHATHGNQWDKILKLNWTRLALATPKLWSGGWDAFKRNERLPMLEPRNPVVWHA